MTDRYDTSGNPEAQFEPGSGQRVLVNKLGIADPAEMDDIELDLLSQLYKDVMILSGKISVLPLLTFVSGIAAGWVTSMYGPVRIEP